jgi:LuxR family maltose regulon positive regulatory protein
MMQGVARPAGGTRHLVAVGGGTAESAQRWALFPTTKFMAPPARREHVPRTRLLAELDGPAGAQHLLISAPAGAGKTTLAAQWAASARRAAWVSLDEEDDEPRRFLTAVIEGIRTVVPGYGDIPLGTLVAGGELRGVLVRLVDELAAVPGEVAAVLDDLHLIRREECLDSLGWMVERAPPNARFVLCTRRDPPLALERLVGRGHLVLVRGPALYFDAEEVDCFVRTKLALDLAPTELAELGERTEGWPAGLYLASLALRSGVPAAELVDHLARDRRIAGYLASEALRHTDPAQLEFLESAAVLGRFSAPLCDDVLQRDDAARMLAELERSNLFVIPLGATGEWFRLHQLFGELLARRLAERDPAAVTRLHERAGAWHRERGSVPEAIHHLLAAGRADEAATLIETHHLHYLTGSPLGQVVGGWLADLPVPTILRSPALLLIGAAVAGLQGRREEMEKAIRLALSLPDAGPLPDGSRSAEAEAAVIRGVLVFGDLERGLEQARHALAVESEASPWWPLIVSSLGRWLLYTEGATDEALALLERAVTLTGTPEEMLPTHLNAPALVGVARLERGEHDGADAAVREAQRRRRAIGAAPIPQAALGWAATARVQREHDRLDDAAREAEAAVRAVEDLPPDADPAFLALPCFLELANVRARQGDASGAREQLDRARERLAAAPSPGRFPEWLRAAAPREAVAGDELSERELAVLQLLPGPLTLREIGRELFVSHNTVKSHTRTIYAKLGAKSRAEAVAAARAAGLLP